MTKGIGAGIACNGFMALKLCPNVYGWEYGNKVYAGTSREFFNWAKNQKKGGLKNGIWEWIRTEGVAETAARRI